MLTLTRFQKLLGNRNRLLVLARPVEFAELSIQLGGSLGWVSLRIDCSGTEHYGNHHDPKRLKQGIPQ